MSVTVEVESEDIRDDEAVGMTWAKSLKEGGITLNGKQFLQVNSGDFAASRTKEFSYVMFKPAGEGGDSEEVSA